MSGFLKRKVVEHFKQAIPLDEARQFLEVQMQPTLREKWGQWILIGVLFFVFGVFVTLTQIFRPKGGSKPVRRHHSERHRRRQRHLRHCGNLLATVDDGVQLEAITGSHAANGVYRAQDVKSNLRRAPLRSNLLNIFTEEKQPWKHHEKK